MRKHSLILFALSLTIIINCNYKKRHTSGSEQLRGSKDSVYFISKIYGDEGIAFYNFGQLSNEQLPYQLGSVSMNDTILSLFAPSPLIVYESYHGVPYIIFPGEHLFVYQDKDGFIRLVDPTDSIRDNELSFFNFLAKSGGFINKIIFPTYFDSIPMLPVGQLRDGSPESIIFLDSSTQSQYRNNLKILNIYKKSHPLSSFFDSEVKSYLLYDSYFTFLKQLGKNVNIEDLPAGIQKKIAVIKNHLFTDTCINIPPYIMASYYLNDLFTFRDTSVDNKFYALNKFISANYTRKSKEYQLLFLFQNNMDKNIPDFAKYINDFITKCSNHYYTNFLNENYRPYALAEHLNPYDKDSSVLIDASGNLCLWKDIFKKYANNKILFDFWASYCVPCIEEIPYSLKLEKKYKRIKFIFLSRDISTTKWKEAINDLHLSNAINYKIVDSRKDPLLKYYDINAMPRYMLFDEGGKLISKDAPRPSDPALEKMIENLLKK